MFCQMNGGIKKQLGALGSNSYYYTVIAIGIILSGHFFSPNNVFAVI